MKNPLFDPLSNIVKFRNIDCEVKFHKYINERIAIQLVAAKTRHNRKIELKAGQPIETCTINPLQIINLEKGEVIIKDNEEILRALEMGKVLKFTGRTIIGGKICVLIN